MKEIKDGKLHSEAYYGITQKYFSPSELTVYDMCTLVIQFLKLCQGILFSAFGNSRATTVQTINETYFDREIPDSVKGERRLVVQESDIQQDRLVRELINSTSMSCYHVSRLEEKEERGIFFEKNLLITKECKLAIISIWFRKEPLDKKKINLKDYKINELVVKAELLMEGDEQFEEEFVKIMDVNLFRNFVINVFDPISFEIERIEKLLSGPKEFMELKNRIRA